MTTKKLTKTEQKRLLVLLKKFEESTRLQETSLYENATIMDTIKMVERVYSL